MPKHWIHDAIGYEVYVRSFCDSNGDGFGDLRGITSRLDHLADLGVDVVWLTPIFPSPDADHGYDVADYDDVDARIGSLDDLDELLAEAHTRGMRVVMDIVPNHSSDRHPWFLDARASRDAPKRSWYVWRDPAPDGGPPNNWVQHFGGSAWTLDAGTGQYWMHLFLPEQPDLNWHNPDVAAEFQDVLRRWFERGVDGFRIDVAHSLLEDQAFRDNPTVEGRDPTAAHPRERFAAFRHVHDLDQDDTPRVYVPWRSIAEEHDAALIGEVYLTDPDRWARYADGTGLHTAFWFPTLHIGWDADLIRTTLEAALVRTGHRTSWPISSHDDPYASTRFGGGELGSRRALAYLAFVATLPGAVFIQQGEELGLDNGVLPSGAAADPITTRNAGAAGRDGTRVPMIWEPVPGWGFSTGEPWLPFATNRSPSDTVAEQRRDQASHLHRVRRLFHLRPSLPRDGTAEFLDGLPAGVVGVRVGQTVALLHAGQEPATVVLPRPHRVRYDTGRVEPEDELLDSVVVAPDSAVILTEEDQARATA